MYKKLLKNFITKNLKIFLLIFISLSISIFWYIFSDSLSRNFLDNIEKDSRENLSWDFVIDIWNREEKVFDDFLEDYEYKDNIEIAKEFSFLSSVKTPDIIPANIVFYTKNYPFYWSLDFQTINNDWDILVSEDLYEKLEDKQELEILWTNKKILWVYDWTIWTINPFFWTENIFINIEKIWDFLANDKNSIINKKYFIKLKDESYFEQIKKSLENNDKLKWIRVTDYKSWWERFEEIIWNLKEFVNYIVLFSFFLTIAIIFLSVSAFFIKERKDISIIRVLWMTNKQFISFYFVLFFSIFIWAFLISLILAKIWFVFLDSFELTKGFNLFFETILKWFSIWISILVFAVILPVIKFLDWKANNAFSENFFWNLSKKEITILSILLFFISLVLSVELWNSILKSAIISLMILVFIFIFYIILRFLLRIVYKNIFFLRKKNFFIFDSIRSTIKPWNMSLLINLNFFIIFSIWLFVLILFWNFYARLKINLDTDKNFFVLNLDSQTYNKLDENYKKESYSILKWRILEINWIDLKTYLWNNTSWRFTREFNITDNKLEDLKILSWEKIKSWWVSLDYNFSKDIWLKIWDKVVFQIYWLEKELEVINIRESRDYSINPFFYFQVYSDDFKEFPKTYFLSSFVENDKKEETKNYFYEISSWTSSFIEINKILEELKSISTKVLIVIKSLFVYISIFSVLSIIVVWLFFSEFQKQNNKLYFFLWATKKQNKIRSFSQYAYLTSLMFIISIIVVSITSYIILSKNTFINFELWVYFGSLFYISLVYIFMILWTWGFVRG